MTTIDIPETPREQRYHWSGFVAGDTLAEIERRFRNLFTPGRGWVRISWYEHAWANSPEVANGLFLDDDPANYREPIHSDDQSVTVRLTHSTVYSVGTNKVATAGHGSARRLAVARVGEARTFDPRRAPTGRSDHECKHHLRRKHYPLRRLARDAKPR